MTFGKCAKMDEDNYSLEFKLGKKQKQVQAGRYRGIDQMGVNVVRVLVDIDATDLAGVSSVVVELPIVLPLPSYTFANGHFKISYKRIANILRTRTRPCPLISTSPETRRNG